MVIKAETCVKDNTKVSHGGAAYDVTITDGDGGDDRRLELSQGSNVKGWYRKCGIVEILSLKNFPNSSDNFWSHDVDGIVISFFFASREFVMANNSFGEEALLTLSEYYCILVFGTAMWTSYRFLGGRKYWMNWGGRGKILEREQVLDELGRKGEDPWEAASTG
ncbi:hypothetical protein CAPTEDRAFT_197166 [Capitella teleta]|uniref:Uncharacterized protein n=1 Tax=Capitella teleta TaxID=283909 RepID=R7UBN9_CAPTE|nr:hypothetical protein CAPTEDRAFT_197166 [Capitella teleta]|eukprot:ELU03506.1 hypothetical protein CAPTEDRAFT_197166 [Capitella teleta]